MVGAAIVRRLSTIPCTILMAPHEELDLTRQEQVEGWVADTKPQAVFLAAARVGGIHANNARRADFIYDNLAIAVHAIDSSHRFGVEKLQFLASSCVYPRLAPQPLKEDALLTGPLEATNEPYAIAKIAGIKLAEAIRDQHGRDFISVMPTNVYGPGDNYHPEDGHVVAALIRRIHEAKTSGARQVTVWGTGTPRREFMFVDDLADACVFAMENYSDRRILNIGCGEDISIAELARLLASVIGYKGSVAFDTSRPDGTPRKLLDVSRLTALGWRAQTTLEAGLAKAYAAFLAGDGRFI
jgi:GDP-L-fucose synthase